MKQTIKNFLFKKRIKILRNKKGFSLLEVLVAVGIIAIISAIAVPQYTANRKEAAKVAGTTSINNIEKAYKHCVALKSHDDCDSLSKLKVSCEDCKDEDAASKFCVQIEKTVGGGVFRACIDFDNGDTTGRAYGGTLLEDVKICYDRVTNCTGANAATDNVDHPQKAGKVCTAPSDCTAGSYTCTSSGTASVAAACEPIPTAAGVCQTTGICKKS